MRLSRDVTRGTRTVGRGDSSDSSSDSSLSETTGTSVNSSSDEDLGPEDSATVEFEPVDG